MWGAERSIPTTTGQFSSPVHPITVKYIVYATSNHVDKVGHRSLALVSSDYMDAFMNSHQTYLLLSKCVSSSGADLEGGITGMCPLFLAARKYFSSFLSLSSHPSKTVYSYGATRCDSNRLSLVIVTPLLKMLPVLIYSTISALIVLFLYCFLPYVHLEWTMLKESWINLNMNVNFLWKHSPISPTENLLSISLVLFRRYTAMDRTGKRDIKVQWLLLAVSTDKMLLDLNTIPSSRIGDKFHVWRTAFDWI